MRRIVSGMFMTLDGVVEAPEQWNPPYYNEETTEVVQRQLTTADVHLYGRPTYELFRSVFTGPSAGSIPHAEMMTNTPKIVVSNTLKDPDWGPTTLINGDVVAELSKLKEKPGKDISVGASGTLVKFLLQSGLLDELSLLVHPVVAGSGKCFFEEGERHMPLELIESRALTTGVVVLNYRPLTTSSLARADMERLGVTGSRRSGGPISGNLVNGAASGVATDNRTPEFGKRWLCALQPSRREDDGLVRTWVV